ncbi:MAG: response regulator, partial [Acidobacteria bacterium]|nr:response regulator [Acidobacteriota bacterium]
EPRTTNHESPMTRCSLLFSVTDTGIGIPADKLATIFESFTQLDSSTTRQYGGTGLGLAISKRLAELMGGRIWVESEVGRGSTFFFTARFELAAEPQPCAALPPLDLTGLKVLVVDDNATNRLILRKLLAGWGTVVSERASGEQGLAELRRAQAAGEPYQLVLLDGRMPIMDGFQVAEQMKADVGTSDITIMMLSSGSRRGDIRRVRELGIAGYVVKPVKSSDLLNAITAAMTHTTTAAMGSLPAERMAGRDVQRPLRILLAEDSEDSRLLIQLYLEKTPHQVEVAENGDIAVEKFQAETYDLVLMDMQMPLVDGYTATRVIRAWEREMGLRPTPIIALTAYALKEEADKSLAAGCTSHLAKPIKRDRLMETICQYTESKAQSAEG